MEFEKFREDIADAIEKGLTVDDEGDYCFDIEQSVESVIDVLERRGMLLFTDPQ